MRASQLILIWLGEGWVRWCGVGVTTDYLVAPVLNCTVLGCNKNFCLLVSIPLPLFHVCPSGWMDGLDYLEDNHFQSQIKYGVGIIVWAWENFLIHSISLSAIGQFGQPDFLMVLGFFLFDHILCIWCTQQKPRVHPACTPTLMSMPKQTTFFLQSPI